MTDKPSVLVDNQGIGVGCSGTATNGGGTPGPGPDLSAYATEEWVNAQIAAAISAGGTSLSQLQAQITQLQNQFNQLAANIFTKTGVTDGSDAQPGQIGEWRTARGVWADGGSVATPYVSLQLSAGDWDVQGQITGHTTGAAAPGGAWTSNVQLAPGTSPSMFSASQGEQRTVTMPRGRVSSSGSITVGIQSPYGGSNTQWHTWENDAAAVITARRVR